MSKENLQESIPECNIDKLCEQLSGQTQRALTPDQFELLQAILNQLKDAKQTPYADSTRRSLHVAIILFSEMNVGHVPLLTALLFQLKTTQKDSFELLQTKLPIEAETTTLLQDLIRVQKLYHDKKVVLSDNFRQLLLSTAKDIRVILILLAGRLFDMRQLKALDDSMQEAIYKECTHLFIPLAHRLGLYVVKTEMEDLALKYSNPTVYFEIAKNLNEKKSSRDAYIAAFIAPIRKELETQGLVFEIKGRTKSIHSIYNKISKGTDFSKVYDLFAIRIILDVEKKYEEAQCWKVYSIISNMYTPSPERFRNWLTSKKSNGYQSLHTTVLAPEGKFVEVQIRSQRMHEVAEMGVAAHWRYKGVKGDSDFETSLKNLRETLENTSSDDANPQHDFKLSVKNPSVFVFTPKGEVKKFPQGATILDFAFSIHTAVGSKCIGAIVNQKHVSFKYKLKSGDQVHIETSSSQTPKSDWLNLVVTSQAKTKIRQAVRDNVYKDVLLGKEALFRRFKNWKLELTENLLSKNIKRLKRKHLHDIYLDIHNELLDPKEVRAVLFPPERTQEQTTEETADDFRLMDSQPEEEEDTLVIDHKLKNILYTLAKCCNPVFGDPIFGFVTTAGGVKIHKDRCPNAKNIKSRFPYRIINARWSGTAQAHRYPASLHIIGQDHMGIVIKISSLITKEFKSTIRSISLDTQDGLFLGTITIMVNNNKTLDKIIKKLRTIKGISGVERLFS